MKKNKNYFTIFFILFTNIIFIVSGYNTVNEMFVLMGKPDVSVRIDSKMIIENAEITTYEYLICFDKDRKDTCLYITSYEEYAKNDSMLVRHTKNYELIQDSKEIFFPWGIILVEPFVLILISYYVLKGNFNNEN